MAEPNLGCPKVKEKAGEDDFGQNRSAAQADQLLLGLILDCNHALATVRMTEKPLAAISRAQGNRRVEDAMPMSGLLDLTLRHAPVRRLTADDPGHWLAAGWRDFRRAPAVSLSYGALFVAIGYIGVLGLFNLGLESLVPVFLASFFLVAPIFAVGLYEVSRRLEAGERPVLGAALAAYRRNPRGIVTMGLVLMLSMAAWAQVAMLLFMMVFHANPPPLEDFFYGILTSRQLVWFIAVGGVSGYVIASVVFAISAVSIPMLLDRDIPVGAAIATSIAAVRENYLVMFGWAATIVFLVGIGLATMFIGLAVILPWVAYATWHSYRALVV